MESPAVMLGKEYALSTWMVVDDEPDIYELLLAMFEFWGIDGVAFVDGSEAIAWIEDVDAMRIQTDLPAMAIIETSACQTRPYRESMWLPAFGKAPSSTTSESA